MTETDAARIQRASSPSVRLERVKHDGVTAPLPPDVPAHSVGMVVLDLDLMEQPLDAAGSHDWAQFFRWLRPEAPVLGCTRTPQLLAARASRMRELTAGQLGAEHLTSNGVRLRRVDAGSPGASGPASSTEAGTA